MKTTEFILRSLVAEGLDHLFMVPGGLIDPFYTAIADVPGLRPIVAAHEGGAAAMADGYARATGGFGACLMIGGPGLTNACTSISAAYTDATPVLVLSGEVSNEIAGLGMFQDASAGAYDDVRIADSITVESYSIPDTRLVHHKYRGALKRMFGAPRGPAHLSIPKDVQTGEVGIEPAPVLPDLLGGKPIDVEAARVLFEMLREAGGGGPKKRIVILAGPEVQQDDAAAQLLRIAAAWSIPVASTQPAKGVIPEDHECALGVFGYAGTRHATVAILEDPPDVLIVLGSAFNQRDTMYFNTKLGENYEILVVAESAVAMSFESPRFRFVRGHPGGFLDWLGAVGADDRSILDDGIGARRDWLARIRKEPRYFDEQNTRSSQVPIHPARVVAEARAVMPRNTIALPDSGAHRAFLVHYWDSFGPRQFITAATIGPMGWAIPAGIGVKAARPDDPVLVLTGDGCMQMHGMEIQVAARYGLPVIFVVDNNRSLGNVWLRAHNDGPVPDDLTTVVDHDWAAFAQSLGVGGETVRDPKDLRPALERARDAGTPYLLDVKTERDAPTPVEPFHDAAADFLYHE